MPLVNITSRDLYWQNYEPILKAVWGDIRQKVSTNSSIWLGPTLMRRISKLAELSDWMMPSRLQELWAAARKAISPLCAYDALIVCKQDMETVHIYAKIRAWMMPLPYNSASNNGEMHSVSQRWCECGEHV